MLRNFWWQASRVVHVRLHYCEKICIIALFNVVSRFASTKTRIHLKQSLILKRPNYDPRNVSKYIYTYILELLSVIRICIFGSWRYYGIYIFILLKSYIYIIKVNKHEFTHYELLQHGFEYLSP